MEANPLAMPGGGLHGESHLPDLCMPLKFSISLRLFLAVLLTSLAVAATGLWMLRDSMQRGFSRYVTEIELGRLEPLAGALEKTWRQQGGQWPALEDREKQRWLRHQMEALRNTPDARQSGLFPEHRPPQSPPEQYREPYPGRMPERIPYAAPQDRQQADRERPGGFGPPPFPPGPPPDRFSLRDRIGLVDASGNPLAGMVATPESPRRALQVDGKTVGYLTLMAAADPADAIAQAFLVAQRQQLLLIALVCVLLSGLAATMLAAHFRKPIRQLLQATQQLTRGRFETRLDAERSDELGALADAVNRLATMLEQHETSRRQWVADTSHELRTPVAVLRAQIDALIDGVRQPNAAQFSAMQRQIAALGKLIDELHQLSRADVGQLEHHMSLLNPWDIVLAEAESFRDRFMNAGLRLRLQPPAQSPALQADASRLQQVLGNLLENSLRYTDEGGEVRISTAIENRRWLLHVDDSAPGVPAEALAQLGTRFFRVERSRNRALGGSGLGLALCQRIVEAHGGQLQFQPSELSGLRVTLSLPLP